MVTSYLVVHCLVKMSCSCVKCVSDLWSVSAPGSLVTLSAQRMVLTMTSCTLTRAVSCLHHKVSDSMNDVGLQISRYLSQYLPGGRLSGDVRQKLLDILSSCPGDPRVASVKETVWSGVINQDVETAQIDGGGISRYHAGEREIFKSIYSNEQIY